MGYSFPRFVYWLKCCEFLQNLSSSQGFSNDSINWHKKLHLILNFNFDLQIFWAHYYSCEIFKVLLLYSVQLLSDYSSVILYMWHNLSWNVIFILIKMHILRHHCQLLGTQSSLHITFFCDIISIGILTCHNNLYTYITHKNYCSWNLFDYVEFEKIQY